ncbi:MAG: Gfo/Idh/MocA family oxidoreductase [Planctomycetales bacterium]|nr:Gfo/Idh/MocA family oxidoreductase [Planctomycetales bacterium]
MAWGDINSLARHDKFELVAVADVDKRKFAEVQKKFPNVRVYQDWRELLEKEADNIDSVNVSTPDHMHGPIGMAAMALGKHLYGQKPLTQNLKECRAMRLRAKEKGVMTQMGIQISSAFTERLGVRAIHDGAIGKIKEVHTFSNKTWGDPNPRPDRNDPVPDGFDWDGWLGVAQERPYIEGYYHPGNWRKRRDFGTGTLGDMGVHIFDTPYAALALTYPKWAKTTCRPPTGVGHPEKNIVEYEFPGTKFTTDSLIWKWYDGGFAPPSGEGWNLPEGFKLPGQGSLFIGEEGVMLLPHVGEAVLFPEEKFKDYQRPDVENGNHYHQWVDACLGKGETSASFAYAGPLTEALLLGVVANRFPEQQLNWDAEKLQVTNLPEANALLKRDYRDEFKVTGL